MNRKELGYEPSYLLQLWLLIKTLFFKKEVVR